MKNILVIYARYGSGHKSAAYSIYNNLKTDKNLNVNVIDLADYATKVGKLSFKIFDYVLEKRKERTYNVCYELVNNKITSIPQKRISKLFFDNDKLREYIKKVNPDLTVNTHYYGGALISYYNKKGRTNSKIITVLTDYAPHSEWLADHKSKNSYIVANSIMKRQLIDYGINKNKIYSYGIPMENEKLLKLEDTEKIRKKYRVNNKKPVALFFGGSTNGSLLYLKYLKVVCKSKLDVNFIFICGKNEKLKKEADKYIKENKIRNIRITGYCTEVYNLLSISDFVVTKPGGITITECMGFKVPMILLPGIGGQEKYNIKYIKKQGYGIFARSLWSFEKALNIFVDENKRVYYKKKLLKRGDINSCDLITNHVKNMLKKKR